MEKSNSIVTGKIQKPLQNQLQRLCYFVFPLFLSFREIKWGFFYSFEKSMAAIRLYESWRHFALSCADWNSSSAMAGNDFFSEV